MYLAELVTESNKCLVASLRNSGDSDPEFAELMALQDSHLPRYVARDNAFVLSEREYLAGIEAFLSQAGLVHREMLHME